MAAIDAISTINSLPGIQDTKSVQGNSDGNSFAKFLTDALEQVNNQQVQAEQAGLDLVAGKNVDIHNVLIATEKASLAMQLTVQVRNKVVEAYQEMMRMQI